MTNSDSSAKSGIRYFLEHNLMAKILEIILVFGIALLFIVVMLPMAGDDIFKLMSIVWFGNIIMITLVWVGNKLRGNTLDMLGVTFTKPSKQRIIKTLIRSMIIFILAITAFILGSIIMANITGVPEQIDTSNYDYIKGNFFMMIISLVGVYIVSSFGEEFVYRAFLITRLTELGLSSKLGRIIVVLISSIIFGLAHYSWGPMGMVQTTFMGIVLAVFYLKYNRDIWPLVLAHLYMDTILIVQMFIG